MSKQASLLSFWGGAAKPATAAPPAKPVAAAAAGPAPAPASAPAAAPTPAPATAPAKAPLTTSAKATATKKPAKKETGNSKVVAQAQTQPEAPAQGQTEAPESKIGKRVRVFWEGEDEWFEGVLATYDAKDDKFLVVYDDGDRESVQFGVDQVELLPANAVASPVKRTRSGRASVRRVKRRVALDSDDEEDIASDSDDESVSEADVKADSDGDSSDSGVVMNSEDDEDDAPAASEDEDDDDDGYASDSPPARKATKRRTPTSTGGTASSRGRVSKSKKSFTPASTGSGSGAARSPAAHSDAPSPTVASPTGGVMVQHEHHSIPFLAPQNRKDANGRKPDHPQYDARTLWVPDEFMRKQSPGHAQWWQFKAQHMDCVLFFKVGKFYELYHMDADIGVKELDLIYMPGPKAHSGFPEKAYGKMSAGLVERGFRVARVEQTETPEMLKERNANKAGKKDKVVAREICAVKTKGTVTYNSLDMHDDVAPPQPGASFLLALVETATPTGVRFGICAVDALSADMQVGEFDDDGQRNRLRTLLVRLPVVEIVHVRDALSDMTRLVLRNFARVALDTPTSVDEFPTHDAAVATLLKSGIFRELDAPAPANPLDVWPAALLAMMDTTTSPPTVLPEFRLAMAAYGGAVAQLRACLIDEDVVSFKRVSMYRLLDQPDAAVPAAGAAAPAEPLRHLILDGCTLANLEILENSFDGTPRGSLLGAMPSPATPMGKRLIRDWICKPLAAIDDINNRLDAVDNLIAMHSAVADASRALAKVTDVERLLSRIHALGSARRAKSHPDMRAVLYEAASYSVRSVSTLLDALDGFEVASHVVQMFTDHASDVTSPLLQSLTIDYPDLAAPLSFFRNAFDRTAAAKTGTIVPRKGVDEVYDAALADIEAVKAQLEDCLAQTQNRLKCNRIKFFHAHKDKYQLEVPEEVLTKHQPDDFELTSKKAGWRRFWTPRIRQLLEDLTAAEKRRDDASKDQTRRIFHKFDEYRHLWAVAASSIAKLDVLIALAAWSKNGDGAGPMCRPQFVSAEAAHLSLVGARHPCVVHTFSGGAFIPNDITLGAPNGKAAAECLLLTGPNMGGKSTLLRQTCACVILAQMGAYVPAEAAVLTPVDRIFTRVGASDRILAGQSTFFVELSETSNILRNATPHSLVILDELGRGTSTFDGNAIAYAVVRHLTQHIHCRTMFATHYHSLTEDFQDNPHVALAHMACMVEEVDGISKVTFLYKLQSGGCPKSYGLNVARLAHLPEDVIAHAAAKSAEFEAALGQARQAVLVSTLVEHLDDPDTDMTATWTEAQGLLTE